MTKHSIGRRQFVAGAVAGAGAACSLTSSAVAGLADRFDYGNFAPLVGSEFSVSGHEHRLRLDLVKIERHALCSPDHARAAGREPFSIFFRGNPSQPIGQETYTLRHPELGSLQLFLTPVGPDRGYYEAVCS